jgi:ABC-type transport system involved in multi-copper enzyme maturation permease subunit
MSITATTPGTLGPRALPPGRYSLPGLLKSEWIKLRTVRSTMWTLGVTILLGIGVSIVAAAYTRGHWPSMSPSARAAFDPVSASLRGWYVGQFIIGTLGVLVMSAEYATGTIRATLTAAPQRLLVLVAKVLVFGTVAFVVAEIVSFGAFFIGQAVLSAPATHATLATPGALRAVTGSGLFAATLSLFALGLATIIRYTAGAISVFAGILLVLPVIVSALPNSLPDHIQAYLPERIGTNLVAPQIVPGSFSPWAGLAIFCGYTLATLAIGGALLLRRDAA